MKITDMSTKYDGRVVRLDVIINTDEDVQEIVGRIAKAARGQQRNASMVGANIFTGDDGRKVWAAVRGLSVTAAADPRAVEVDEDMRPR